MKAVGKYELERMQVKQTLGDEFGIYFRGEGQSNLAFAFPTAKKAISSIKKLKKVLGVQYNIEKEVLEIASKEEEVIEITEEKQEKGIQIMANKKRGVNVKQLCRDAIDNGMSEVEILTKVADVFLGEGKDEKYAKNRSWAYYVAICKEKGKAPPKKTRGKAVKAESAEPNFVPNDENPTPEGSTDSVETAKAPEVPTQENTAVGGESELETAAVTEETEEKEEVEETD